MAYSVRWTTWNLTPDGWQYSETADVPAKAMRYRPPETLLSLLSSTRAGAPVSKPLVIELFRSSDDDVLAAALAEFGEMPPN